MDPQPRNLSRREWRRNCRRDSIRCFQIPYQENRKLGDFRPFWARDFDNVQLHASCGRRPLRKCVQPSADL